MSRVRRLLSPYYNQPPKPALRLVLPLIICTFFITIICSGCEANKKETAEIEYQRHAKAISAPYQFNIVSWEVSAVGSELLERILVPNIDPSSVPSQTRVLAYLETAKRIGTLEDTIEQITVQMPDSDNRRAILSPLQAELASLRELRTNERPAVERILEMQVSNILAEEGIGWFGRSLPPPTFEFADLPDYLILSPRDKISLRTGIYMLPDLSVAQRENLEAKIEQQLPNTSALVEGTGGFSTWPSMVMDQASLEWILSTIAHEWVHIYLMPYPMGMHYYDNSDISAMNETVASIVGDEIGAKAYARYYSNFVSAPEQKETSFIKISATESFDFTAEMRLTRETVDSLLAAGKVREAEQYMEERREIFVQNGYYIRKLNQAYFAFHGNYRTSPEAPSKDPIAPRLRRLRHDSSNLADMLTKTRQMQSLDDLIAVVPTP